VCNDKRNLPICVERFGYQEAAINELLPDIVYCVAARIEEWEKLRRDNWNEKIGRSMMS